MDAIEVGNPEAWESVAALDTLGESVAAHAAHTACVSRSAGAHTLFATPGSPRRGAYRRVGKGWRGAR